MKKILFFAALFSIVLAGFAFANMACSIKQSSECSNDNTVFKMSSDSNNAHGAIYSTTNPLYTWAVCCEDGTKGHECSENNGVINLSGTENAHAEYKTGNYYHQGVCFGGLSCNYRVDNCNANEMCLASMAEITNAQLGNCGAYQTKICCEDCVGNISGTVLDADNNIMEYASISVMDVYSLEEKYSGQTNSQGKYKITAATCSQYHLTASKGGYLSSTIPNKNIAKGENSADFTGNYALVPGTTCEADCSYAEDDHCHKECDAENGCGFYDSVTKNLCDLAKVGWEKDYNSSHVVDCCKGAPTEKSAVVAATGVGCSNDNFVEITKIIMYNGKPINVVVVVCE